ncbi:site-specific integrase [Ectobacillus antri]|uniref:Site-specific integrase n=1 Tax=Ectobacillus antri TaxID=2486280 RepID=A0ABT6H2V2_9BACI|nr:MULTISPECIES: site-specific integrase [Ectobacillus]MDG4658097.1 site-specific integrase [Ectobacillus antri]MDG5753662.1 site-specific integrase [Ectobacillus antri]UOY93296.1 site-specific integrase [Ectobacillus sp. JY-23]
MTIRKLRKSWGFRIDIGRDPRTNKRIQKSFSGYRTKREAQDALAEIQVRISNKSFLLPDTRTFGQFFEHWLETYFKKQVSITTYEQRLYMINKHIIPYFEGFVLRDITTFHIDEFLHQKLEEGLSRRYVKMLQSLLYSAFETAFKWKLVQHNCVRDSRSIKIEMSEKEIWTKCEINTFLDVAKKKRRHLIYMLAIYTGMRIGEILGLTWDNVDLDNEIIKVKQSLAYTKQEGFLLKSTKTMRSNRNLPIPATLTRELLQLNRSQKSIKLSLGEHYNPFNLVFCSSTGTPLYVENVRRQFNRLIQQSEVKKITLHDLRHTHGSLLNELGESPKVIQERLGHSCAAFTLDTYIHTDTTAQVKAINRLEKELIKSDVTN